MKKRYLSLIMFFFTIFIGLKNVNAAIKIGDKYDRIWTCNNGYIGKGCNGTGLRYKGTSDGGLTYYNERDDEVQQWKIYTYYASRNNERHFMYCLDPNASGAAAYRVDRFLGVGDANIYYDLGLMAIMYNGYDENYNTTYNGLSGYDLQVATSIAMRSWTLGLFDYGRNYVSKDHTANYSKIIINQGAIWGSFYHDRLSKFSNRSDCESSNAEESKKCLQNLAFKKYSEFYTESDKNLLFGDNYSGTSKLVHETAYKLFQSAAETAMLYEAEQEKEKEKENNDNNNPKVSITGGSSSVNHTQQYLEYSIIKKDITDEYSIKNVHVTCEDCNKYGITISAGEYYNGSEWVQFSLSDDLIPVTPNGDDIDIRFLVTIPEKEDLCDSVSYNVSFDLIDNAKTTTTEEGGASGSTSTEEDFENTIKVEENLPNAVSLEELTKYEYILLRQWGGGDNLQRFVFKHLLDSSETSEGGGGPVCVSCKNNGGGNNGSATSSTYSNVYESASSSLSQKVISSETEKIECYQEKCAAIEHLPLCTYERDDATINYKDEAEDKIKSCILGKEDAAGNTYQLAESNGGIDNAYCKIFCKEDYANIQFTPIIKDVKCGGYFKLSAHIEGTKDCYTSGGDKSTDYAIGGTQYKEDVKAAQEEMIKAHNEYLEIVAAEKLLDSTVPTVKEYCGDVDECTRNCDIDGDGNYDLNIDTDGDGKADLNIDSNGDKIADAKVDNDGDRVCKDTCNPSEVCDPKNPKPGCCKQSDLVDKNCSSEAEPFSYKKKVESFIVKGTYNAVKPGTQTEEGIVPIVSAGVQEFSYGEESSCTEKYETFDRDAYVKSCLNNSTETDEEKAKEACNDAADDAEEDFKPSYCNLTCSSNGSTKASVKEELANKKVEVLNKIALGKEHFDKAINMYNSCTTGWKNEFKFGHEIWFDYAEEQYMKLLGEDQKKLVTVDGSQTEESKIEICTGETNEQYQCSTDVIELEKPDEVNLDQYGYNSSYENAFNKVAFTVCDNKTGECNNDGVPVSIAKFIHIGVSKKADYITPTVFYQIDNTSKITSQSESPSPNATLVPLENGLPISAKSTGTDWFKLSLRGLGEFYNNGKLGRIFDIGGENEENSVGHYLYQNGTTVDDNGNVVESVKGWNTEYGIGQDGEYYCVFENACRDPGCPNCDPVCDPPTDIGTPECGWKECPECIVTCVNCLFNLNELQLSFKSISTTKFNSANRAIGYNWDVNTTLSSLKLISSKASKTIEEITQMNETIYQDNQDGSSGSPNKDSSNASLGFSIRMTPEVTSYIRDYNDKIEAQGIGGYANDSLTCYDYDGFNGILCYSDFLDELIDAYDDKGLITVRNRTEEGQRESNPNSDGYWTFWEDYKKPECALDDPSYPNCSTSVIGGPAWK